MENGNLVLEFKTLNLGLGIWALGLYIIGQLYMPRNF